MSLTSKTYIKLKEKQKATAIKKINAQKEVEISEFIAWETQDEYNASVSMLNSALEEARKAELVLKAAREAQMVASDEYEKARKQLDRDRKNHRNIIDEEFDIKWKMEALELEEKNKAITKTKHDEQRGVLAEKKKNKTKDYFSERILNKLSKMPDEIKRIVCGFLSFSARVSLLDDNFKSIVHRYHHFTNNNKHHNIDMLTAYLDYISTQPEFLGLLTRKEARHQIPSITPRGFKWRHYSWIGIANYPKLLYNRILWATEMAKTKNPKFAYKIMKTMIVFGSVEGKYKVSSTVNPKNYLTIEDLPTEYR